MQKNKGMLTHVNRVMFVLIWDAQRGIVVALWAPAGRDKGSLDPPPLTIFFFILTIEIPLLWGFDAVNFRGMSLTHREKSSCGAHRLP